MHNVLIWGLGENCEEISLENNSFDEDRLLELIELHNIAGRFKRQLILTSPDCFSNYFIEKLNDLNEKISTQVNKNIDATMEIVNNLTSDKDMPIIIKGYSTYLLTSKSYIIRNGDIDLVASCSRTMIEVLEKDLYKKTKLPFIHEAGEYTRGSIAIDIHNYFPIYYYNKELNQLSFKNKEHNFNMPNCKIMYDDLYNHSYLIKEKNIRVADANILSIIICGHAFMNYINMWSISHREKTYIKLGELADLFSLVKHPTFSIDIFNDLMYRYKAEDAVSWASSIMLVIFNTNPLPDSKTITKKEALNNLENKFPRCLWWGFWANVPFDIEKLLYDNWYDMNILRKAFRFNKTKYNNYYKLISWDGEYFKSSDVLFELDFIAKHKEKFLIIIHFPCSINSEYHIRLDFGNIATEIILDDSIKNMASNSEFNVDVKRNAEKYTVSIESDCSFHDKECYFMLGVSQHKMDELCNALLIPLNMT